MTDDLLALADALACDLEELLECGRDNAINWAAIRTDLKAWHALRLPPCDMCGGTGWLQIEDPILGGTVDTACPECVR